MSGVTFIYSIHVGHNTLADPGWRPDHPGGPGARRRLLPALMVDALESPLASSQGPIVDVS
jgi:hypothetical protein